MGNDVIIDVVVNADQAVATMGQVAAKTGQVTAATSVSGAEFRRAGTALGHFGQAMTNILMLTNLLPGSMGKAVNTTLLLATTTINAVYAISQLKKAYDALTASIAASIVITNLHTAASLKNAGASAASGAGMLGGLGKLGGAGILSKLGTAGLVAGVGMAAYAGTTALMNRNEGGGGRTNITINNGGMGNMSDEQVRALGRQMDQELNSRRRLGES